MRIQKPIAPALGALSVSRPSGSRSYGGSTGRVDPLRSFLSGKILSVPRRPAMIRGGDACGARFMELDSLYNDPDLAQFYDIENAWSEDLTYCRNLASGRPTILDLGCGTGLLAA